MKNIYNKAKQMYDKKFYFTCANYLYNNTKAAKVCIWSLIVLSFVLSVISICLTLSLEGNAAAGVAAAFAVGVVVVAVTGVGGVAAFATGAAAFAFAFAVAAFAAGAATVVAVAVFGVAVFGVAVGDKLFCFICLKLIKSNKGVSSHSSQY